MNQNDLVKEICKREQGVGKGLNAAQVKTILRHLGDIVFENEDDSILKKIMRSAKRRYEKALNYKI